MRAAAVLLACVALAACGSDSEPGSWPEGTPPCAQEDSPGPCYWDAGTQGNGAGRTFWVDAGQHVHYIDGGT